MFGDEVFCDNFHSRSVKNYFSMTHFVHVNSNILDVLLYDKLVIYFCASLFGIISRDKVVRKIPLNLRGICFQLHKRGEKFQLKLRKIPPGGILLTSFV